MAVSAVATFARGSDPAGLAYQTAERLMAAAGSQPVRAGVLFLSGMPQPTVCGALVSALPGVQLMVTTTGEPGPSLAGLWLVGDVRAVVTDRLRPEQDGRALAEAAVARAGFKAFQTRLALLAAASCEPLLGGLFEVLPRGAAFVGLDAPEVWTETGPVQEALLVADWPTRLAVGFEGPAQVLERKGLPADSCVGMLRLRTAGLEAEGPSAALANVPQIAAQVTALYGVPDRSPKGPATATLALSDLKERAEAG